MKSIREHIVELIKEFEISNVPSSEINRGECMNFAEILFLRIKDQYLNVDIISDAMFFDSFDTETDLWNPNEYGIVPDNFNEKGMPCHYWIFVNGKHYDSDVPDGTTNMFELPTLKNYYL